MAGRKRVKYRITDYTVILPNGAETELHGCVFRAPTDDDAIAAFNRWREDTVQHLPAGAKLSSKKPELRKIETTDTKLA